jgi:hypothetical protein
MAEPVTDRSEFSGELGGYLEALGYKVTLEPAA